ncbi:MAG: glycosyltransferase family 4 protein [Pyrinomonadaceae bacterium]
MPKRPTILIICDYYLPGFESGGAVRTLANMVDRLGEIFDFRIITRDHDGSAVKTPYTTVDISEWNQIGNAKVYYLSKEEIRARTLTKLINESAADAIYLNSFFSRLTIIYLTLLRFRRIEKRPTIMAPEGEFSPGALSLNPLRKKLYIANARVLLLSKSFTWKAAADEEKEDIVRVFGRSLDIHVAPNMPPKMIYSGYDQSTKPAKEADEARMIFLSRFMRKKNFNWLLEHLRGIEGKLSIDICGTLEEKDYWEECRRIAATLPKTISIKSLGPIPHEQVSETLARYDFFVLPTLGENFGHVFIEALASGVPLIISDRTPWRGLATKRIGWDLSLEHPSEWSKVVQTAVSMDNGEYRQMSAAARKFAVEWLSDPEIERSNIAILNASLKR